MWDQPSDLNETKTSAYRNRRGTSRCCFYLLWEEPETDSRSRGNCVNCYVPLRRSRWILMGRVGTARFAGMSADELMQKRPKFRAARNCPPTTPEEVEMWQWWHAMEKTDDSLEWRNANRILWQSSGPNRISRCWDDYCVANLCHWRRKIGKIDQCGRRNISNYRASRQGDLIHGLCLPWIPCRKRGSGLVRIWRIP